MIDLSEAEALMDQGWELLRRRNAPEALKIGQRLERRRYSGGFEMQALALNALKRRREAISVLERGVATVPGNWLLWQLLGSYRSDDGDYEGACEAYERAFALPCDQVSLGYNHANALARAGRWDDAKARIEPLFASDEFDSADPKLGLYIVNLYEDILRNEGRDNEADAFVEAYAGVIARGEGNR